MRTRLPLLRKLVGQRPACRRPRRLAVEILEDRRTPAIFTVNSLADLSLAAGVDLATGAINGTNHVVTLRSAIQAANQTPGGSTVDLALAGTYKITQAPTNTNVVGVLITNGGSGYTFPPAVFFSFPNLPGGTRATGTAIVSNGAVVGVTLTNPGSGYTTAPSMELIPNTGSGATGTPIVGEDDNLVGELAVLPTGDLTIQNTSGANVVIDGGGLSRVFDINPNNTDDPATHFTVTLSGLTIQSGRAL
jgi:hypothetical protein